MDTEAKLREYYKTSFPANEIFRILEINENREISFFTSTDIYIRYQTFSTLEAFKEKIMAINPKKMDAGPFYNIRPSKGNGAIPVARELVFDIDLTDYRRDCCQEKTVCKKCYEKIKCGVRLLNYILKEEFGFTKFGFVFSGRRGFHCWVFEMKEMSATVRNDIYKYFQGVIDKNLFVKAYDTIMRDYGTEDLVEDYFVRIDKQVTVSMGHLIKIPFSVHPDTEKISVPLDPEDISELEDIPTLSQVALDPSILKPYVRIMRKWC